MTYESLITELNQLGPTFAARELEHDQDDSFVSDNYAALRELRIFAAGIPTDLGGGGLTYTELANLLRVMAHYSPSTALAHSMHHHLVAANVWKYKKGKGGEPILKKVVAEQPNLISTGAKDWLASNGTMQKTDGGYRLTAEKYFSSQSAAGGIAVTSAQFEHPEAGWQVLHFGVPLTSEGVSLVENWRAMGMRGTGSHMIRFDNVFVPEASIALSRPCGEYHPVWNTVLGCAMPLIMAVYIGVAEKAVEMALTKARQWEDPKPFLPSMVGKLNNTLVTAVTVWEDMLRINNNYDFAPVDQIGQDMLTRKTIVANTVKDVVAQSMDLVGGQSFFRSFGLEKLFRDVQGAEHHPLPEKEQLHFSGEYILKQ